MPTLGEIADVLAVAVPEQARALALDGIAALDDASSRHIAFLIDASYLRQLPATRAAAVIVGAKHAPAAKAAAPGTTVLLETEDAAAALQRALEHLAMPVPRPVGVHPSAVIAKSALLAANVAAGPHVVVGERTRVGAGTILHAGVVIGDEVSIGGGCELFAGVAIRERCTLGDRVIIHANSVVGTDGFGYRWDGAKHAKQPHIGTVIIEDDVEIGSCTCIDRGKIGETRIGMGTKIDNLVQIGHNVRIGRHCILCAGVGVAGTARIGHGVILAGAAGIADHVEIGDGARAGALAGVHADIPTGQTVIGVPAVPYRDFWREQAALRKLPETTRTLRSLASRLEKLEAALKQDSPDKPPQE